MGTAYLYLSVIKSPVIVVDYQGDVHINARNSSDYVINTFILVNEKKLQVIAVLLRGCLGIYSVNATPRCTLCYPGVTKGDIGSKCMRYVSFMKEEIP